jgi:hypothetical protein
MFLGHLATAAAAAGPAGVDPPGPRYEIPSLPTGAGAPQIYEHSQEAGPDETFFLVGQDLTRELFVWGAKPDDPAGGPVPARIQCATAGYLTATLPDRAVDGPLVVAVKNAAGYAAPIVLNAPQPWWCHPATAEPGRLIRVFGRNLARRPDGQRAFVYLGRPGGPGQWADAIPNGKYSLKFKIPFDAKPGPYEVWVHAGQGGSWGWGGPLKLRIHEAPPRVEAQRFRPASPADLQQALDAKSRRGGGVLELPAGTFPLSGTLRIPAGVVLRGAGQNLTQLALEPSPPAAFARFAASGWNSAPAKIHTPGDTMTYELDVPQAGRWAVWLRYATEMSPWKLPGVSGRMTLAADDQPPVSLENLPNTGGFGTFRWSRSATLDLSAGRHKLLWKNVRGGGIALDAFVFARDSAYVPSDAPLPVSGRERIVLQAEDCVQFACKEGQLPGQDRAAVWLAGDNAGLEDLTVLGSAQVNQGIAIRAPEATAWIAGCRLQRVRVADCEGKQGENCGVYVRNARDGLIVGNQLWGRTPLFLSGARQMVFSLNLLISVTRFGGNSEAAILGRTEPIEECLIERNLVAAPPGAEAGGPTARRMIWLSTGHGSISHNWLSGNGVEAPLAPGAATGAGQARFGGVAGTDQNVGETILFEGNHRTAYFGPLEGADRQSVTLPTTLPPTPDERLGSVKREQLAHDAQGRETPFWPPDADDGTAEPPISEYYVTILAGRGQGQTRRVVRRLGPQLLLDRPWRVAPQRGSRVAVGTGFYQNLIVGNYVPDGMTGVQLWISCVENVIAGNTIVRQRKPGLFLYANGSTLASSMPRTWNRGVSPLFWNLVEGNRTEECSDGALITSGDAAGLPIEFPRALGNVLRHNSFVRSRSNGVVITSRKAASGVKDSSASILGTIAEFNVVRDAAVAYHAAESCDCVVFRRDHAYFWNPATAPGVAPVAFQVDNPASSVAIEANSIEGPSGVLGGNVVPLKNPTATRK